MARASELIDEALATLNNLRTNIENRVLSKSASLKPAIVSLAQNIVEASNLMTKLFEITKGRAGDLETDSIVIVNPWWSISVYNSKIVITRHKPLVASLSYDKDSGTVSFKTKVLGITITPAHIVLQKLGAKIEFDPSNPEELSRKLDIIKYMLRDIMRALELMTVVAEKRLK